MILAKSCRAKDVEVHRAKPEHYHWIWVQLNVLNPHISKLLEWSRLSHVHTLKNCRICIQKGHFTVKNEILN